MVSWHGDIAIARMVPSRVVCKRCAMCGGMGIADARVVTVNKFMGGG